MANTLLLHGLSGVKATVALASWAGCEVVAKLRGSFSYPLTVRRENGSCTTLTVVRTGLRRPDAG